MSSTAVKESAVRAAFEALIKNDESVFLQALNDPRFRPNELLPALPPDQDIPSDKNSLKSKLPPTAPVAQPLLHKAVMAGNQRFAKLLIDHGALVDARDAESARPLELAVEYGWLSCARMLVSEGADYKSPTFQGISLLHLAAMSGASNCLKWLLTFMKGEVNTLSTDGFSPIFHVVDYDNAESLPGRLECTEILMDHGADVNIQDMDGNTVAHWAANQKQIEILSLILSSPQVDLNVKNHDGQTALDLAIINYVDYEDKSFQDVVERVAERKLIADVKGKNTSTLARLLIYVRSPTAKAEILGALAETDQAHKFISKFSKVVNNVDYQGFRPIFHAIYGNSFDSVKALVAHGAEINQSCGTIDEDRPNMTPVSVACLYGRMKIAKFLIDHGADVLDKEECKANAIHRLVDSENSDEKALSCLHEMLDFFSKRGQAEIFQQAIDDGDSGGWSTMVYCADYNKVQCIQFMIDHMSDPSKPDENGNDPLIWAAFRGRFDAIKVLLSARKRKRDLKDSARELFDPNHQNDTYGNTALHYAAYRAHVSNDYKKCVLALLQRGASPDIANKKGQRPVDLIDPKETDLRKRLTPPKSSLKQGKSQKPLGRQIFPQNDISGGREKFNIPWENDVDDEPGPRPFVYICEPIAGKNVTLPGPSTEYVSCLCGWRGGCRVESMSGRCECALLYEDKEFPYALSSENTGLSSRVLNKKNVDFVIMECTETCSCSIYECPNRVVQRGIVHRLAIFKTGYRGWACKTLEKIKKGTFVLEYVGEIITEVEAEQRSTSNAHRSSYIWSLTPQENEISETNYAVDADRLGSVARFLNHSCDPNLVAREAFVQHRNMKFPRIAFFARRDIQPQEELTFDYCYQPLTLPGNLFRCHCGAKSCKGILT
jgi:ankyrin repeat protein